MIHFIFSEKDKRYLFLKYDKPDEYNIMLRLKDHINLIDPICYLPTYCGAPFTQDFIWEYVQPTGDRVFYCSIGLWQAIYKWLKENNIPFDGLLDHQQFFRIDMECTFEEFTELVNSWGMSISPRPYQLEAAYKILSWKHSVSSLSTRAGKTLIAYMIFRYMIEKRHAKKILAIVPSITLVKQMYDDFNQYKEFFKTECIWAGGSLVKSANFTVGTFQSLIKFLDKKSPKYNPSFFDDFDVLFVDETHKATAAQIKMIVQHNFMKEMKLAFGMTGTLPKEKTISYYALHALLGAKIQEVSPRELMDDGYISEVDIKQIRLRYASPKVVEQVRDLYIEAAEYGIGDFIYQKNAKGKNEKVLLSDPKFLMKYEKTLPVGVFDMKFQLEKSSTNFKKDYISFLKKFVTGSTKTTQLNIEKMVTHLMNQRVEYLCNDILPKCDRNTLVLAHHTEYLRFLYEEITNRFPNKHVMLIVGSTGPKERTKIIDTMKQYDDCILVASYGTLSTGITLHNLCFGVLFESFKSEVVNIQSIGRGLGLSSNKDKFVVYDVVDVYNTEYASNKLYLQGIQRMKLYGEYSYPAQVIDVRI